MSYALTIMVYYFYYLTHSYLLNTQAGFVIERKGVASITSVGPSIEVRLEIIR